MKYLRQFCIILLISALGEGLHILLPLPVPASVYGLVLMLGALTSGIWLPVVIITILTTVIVMVVTGRSTQFVIKKDRRKEKK